MDLREHFGRADNPQRLLGRCRQHTWRGWEPWHEDVADFYCTNTTGWGWWVKPAAYWHAGQVVDGWGVKQPNKHDWEFRDLDPAFVIAHCLGRETVYYYSKSLLCIDIDDHGDDRAGVDRLFAALCGVLPLAKFYVEPSRGGRGIHLYFKVVLTRTEIWDFSNYLLGLSRRVNNHSYSPGDKVAHIDHLCGTQHQCVNMPFFKSEGQWAAFRDMASITGEEIGAIIGAIQKRYGVHYKRLETPKDIETPLLVPIHGTTLNPRGVRDYGKLLRYADHQRYPDRWRAKSEAAFIAARWGWTEKAFIDYYQENLSDDGKEDGALGRAYAYAVKRVAKQGKGTFLLPTRTTLDGIIASFSLASLFSFSSKRPFTATIQSTTLNAVKGRKGFQPKDKSALYADVAAVFLCCIQNSPDGHLSRDRWLEVCGELRQAGVTIHWPTNYDLTHIKKVLLAKGIIRITKPYSLPRDGKKGLATSYAIVKGKS